VLEDDEESLPEDDEDVSALDELEPSPFEEDSLDEDPLDEAPTVELLPEPRLSVR
jgi:hypothetical protein